MNLKASEPSRLQAGGGLWPTSRTAATSAANVAAGAWSQLHGRGMKVRASAHNRSQ